jgi:hypothetical protein
MKKEINFPLIFGDKVYYSFEEIPADIQKILEASAGSEFVEISSTKKWEINGVVYTNFEDIPEEFRYLVEDKNNNGVPDFVEGVLGGVQGISKTNNMKSTTVQNFQFDNKNSLHKKKYVKERGNKDYKFIFTVFLFSIILALLAYIILSRK